jgi:hypothetical protein
LKRKTVLRFLVAFACFLFTVSVFCPFLQAQWFGMHIPEVQPRPEYFWSFKETYEFARTPDGFVVEEYWFEDYWCRGRIYDITLGPWIAPALIFMLGAQVFTVLFATLAIFYVKPYLLLSSTVLTVFTMFCMWFVSNTLSHWYIKKFEAGFWLSLLSVTLFIAAMLLSWKRLQKAKPTTVEDIAAETKKIKP